MKPLHKDFISAARSIIEVNYFDDSFGCPSLCEALDMSRSQVHRNLSATIGMSCSEFIQQIRLEKAKELLLSTDHSVHEIAFKVGYTDANYFSRSFSKIYGFPPTQCRLQSA